MSVFENKNILVIGDETNQVHAVEYELEERGAHLTRTLCGTLPDSFMTSQVDIVLLSHLHDGSVCTNFLSSLGTSKLSKAIPVFALVNDDKESIEAALKLGAADYFTPHESVETIIKKIALVFGEPDVSGRSIIEINERKPRSTKEGVRVYAIEDDPLLGNLLTMRLEQAKFLVSVDTTGHNAIAQIREFKPDVVILDLSLPTESGFDILAAIRNESDLEKLPVIVFSNRDSDEDKERAASLGAQAFFVKVMTEFRELIEAIERLV